MTQSQTLHCVPREFKTLMIYIKKKKEKSTEGNVKEQHVENEVDTVNSDELGRRAPTARCSAFGHISNT
jgi:hypothetical protein